MILLIVIFQSLTILVKVDIDLKLPILLPLNDMEENEVRLLWPREKEVNSITKEENSSPKYGNLPKAEKTDPQLLLPWRTPLIPENPSNGSSKKMNENGFLTPENCLKASSELQNVKPNSSNCQNNFHLHPLIFLCHICHWYPVFLVCDSASYSSATCFNFLSTFTNSQDFYLQATSVSFSDMLV